MKWKKLGRILDTTKALLPKGRLEFAQAPQALVFDDFVRIYFSTRERDAGGKYISNIFYSEMDSGFQEIRTHSQHMVIELGALGCFDEHGIFPINVVRNGDAIMAYTCGWSRRTSVPVETSIGLAISDDQGATFL